MRDFNFSDAQALGALTSTGVVSTNVFDMELDGAAGNTIIEDDQLVGVVNITIPPLAGQTAAEGMNIYLRSGDNSDMVTSAIDLGSVFVSLAEMIAGCVKNIEIHKELTQKFVGLFYDPANSTLVTGQTVDAHFHIAPLTENDKMQKVPSR
ncbi:hypothetical protein KAR91_57380 [Candidatus Pacearchaeota archaeon]|nr:hypothetical protein [Candidatus Pacearchaeota archaeon]